MLVTCPFTQLHRTGGFMYWYMTKFSELSFLVTFCCCINRNVNRKWIKWSLSSEASAVSVRLRGGCNFVFFFFFQWNQISEFWGAHVWLLYCACRSFDITISRILYHHLCQHTKSERTSVLSDDILNPLFLSKSIVIESCWWWFQTTCAIEFQGEQSLQLSPISGCMGD